MYSEFTILIADRNRHVREFLRRELMADEYRVEVAKDGQELLLMISESKPPDLLILDLDIPFAGGVALLERLRHRVPSLPIIIHSFITEYSNHPAVQQAAAFVEKMGNIDRLKAVVVDVLRRNYPNRFESAQGN